MRVLLTNDDGVDASGLQRLRDRLVEVADSVVTVAPEEDRSGFARRTTYSRPVRVRRVVGGTNPVFACDGTPTDCVRVGLLGGVGLDPQLVVSGINHGANLADDVTSSGTVGAGLEAAVLGVSALCLSQQTPTGSFAVNYREDLAARGLAYDFSWTADHGARLALALAGSLPREPVVLNVNYPTRVGSGPAEVTVLGRRAYPRLSAQSWSEDEAERLMYLFGEPDEEFPHEDDESRTDIEALRASAISVTALQGAMSQAQTTLPAAVLAFLSGREPVLGGEERR